LASRIVRVSISLAGAISSRSSSGGEEGGFLTRLVGCLVHLVLAVLGGHTCLLHVRVRLADGVSQLHH
jgi:hypothetical protein